MGARHPWHCIAILAACVQPAQQWQQGCSPCKRATTRSSSTNTQPTACSPPRSTATPPLATSSSALARAPVPAYRAGNGGRQSWATRACCGRAHRPRLEQLPPQRLMRLTTWSLAQVLRAAAGRCQAHHQCHATRRTRHTLAGIGGLCCAALLARYGYKVRACRVAAPEWPDQGDACTRTRPPRAAAPPWA